MLALIGIANLANLSLLSPAIPGPECYLAGRPLLVVTVVFGQIVVTLIGEGFSQDRLQIAVREGS